MTLFSSAISAYLTVISYASLHWNFFCVSGPTGTAQSSEPLPLRCANKIFTEIYKKRGNLGTSPRNKGANINAPPYVYLQRKQFDSSF